MSQACEMEVSFDVGGLVALQLAVRELGLLLQEEEKRLLDDLGRAHEVDFVVSDGAGARFGVRYGKEGGASRIVAADDKGHGLALAKRVIQRYARSCLLDELKRKGYEIGEEKVERDGTIKLVARRWR